jgi:hypothetical protein
VKLEAPPSRPREAALASYQNVNVGAAQELKDMPDAIRIRLPGDKGRHTDGRRAATNG